MQRTCLRSVDASHHRGPGAQGGLPPPPHTSLYPWDPSKPSLEPPGTCSKKSIDLLTYRARHKLMRHSYARTNGQLRATRFRIILLMRSSMSPGKHLGESSSSVFGVSSRFGGGEGAKGASTAAAGGEARVAASVGGDGSVVDTIGHRHWPRHDPRQQLPPPSRHPRRQVGSSFHI